jgi:NTE family protein
MSPDDLEAVVSETDWMDALADNISRRDRSFRRKRDDDLYLIKIKPGFSDFKLKFPPGLIDGQKVDLLLKRYTLPVVAVRDFDELSIPYRAVAADIETGKAVVIGEGDLAMAMRASMSIPSLFAPREIDGKLLVDGGVSKNLPIDVVRQMGADIVIAVDISTPLDDRDELQSVIGITAQLTGILSRRDTELQIGTLTDKDIFIEPDLGDIATGSFERAAEAIPTGVAAAKTVLDQLEKLSVTAEEYNAYLAGHECPAAEPIIDEIRIVNQSRVGDPAIASRLRVETGEALDPDRLQRDLGRIYGLELFESVYYDVEEESGRTTLTVTARERSWGPNYLQFGVAGSADFKGTNRANLAVAYVRTAVNRLSGEWRTGAQAGQEPGLFTELYQPLTYKRPYFIQPAAWIDERSVFDFDARGNKLSESRVTTYGAGLDFGRDLGTWAEIRVGMVRETGTVNVRVGDPSTPDSDFDRGEAFAQFYLDELDDAVFPSSGGSLRVRAALGREALGSEDDYEQGTVEASLAKTMGHYTGLFGGIFETTRNSDAPAQSEFLLGGFTQLSGLVQNELKGQHAILLSAQFYRKFRSGSLLPMYAGLSLEYGNVFDTRGDIELDSGVPAGSVFLGFDTLIGPDRRDEG